MESWLFDAIRNLTYRSQMETSKREELDKLIEELQQDGISGSRREEVEERIEWLLNNGVHKRVSNSLTEAARKGFYSDENAKLEEKK